ncbi:GREB1-like protein isoform X3 [Strongylocentrotus purpuratus]|uniref:GREB1-like protein n=1 Tax=Strongylocentrotus purpuratus TaxID=7668 RepID=A0A7M7NN80_STRPU|nr:GREB1-like protein isoform X3 [Strongylocentrotus purpuratus]
MGNSQGQLKSSRFEAALHMSIEQSLRSSAATPQPVFSQLYLDKDIKPNVRDIEPHGSSSEPKRRKESVSSVSTENNNKETMPSTSSSTAPSPKTPLEPRTSGSSSSYATPHPKTPLPSPLGLHPSVVHPSQPGIPTVMLPSPRLPLSPYLPAQRFIIPGQYPAHPPPPLIQQPPSSSSSRPAQEARISQSSIPPTVSTAPSSASSSRTTSPRLMKDESVYRREEIENSSFLYGALTLRGCQEVGFCQAGSDIRLTELSDKQIEVPKGFVLVGTKSPYLPENILVAAVDARFLPDPNTNLALLGFSGNCVGCGEKGFRYFTEFSHHINLKLTTQAKKQKHLKYYIVRNKQGHLVRGPNIPWKECRKTNYSSTSVYHGALSPSMAGQTSVIVSRPNTLTPGSQDSPQPRTSPSANINHYGNSGVAGHTSSPGQAGGEGLDPHGGAGRMQASSPSSGDAHPRPGESESPSTAQQPLKKRRRFHSMDDDKLRPGQEQSRPTHHLKRASIPTLPPPALMHPPNFVPPPVQAAVQDCTFVPPGLAEACGTKIIILDCSGNLPVFHGNMMDILVSVQFRDSLKPRQHISPHLAESLGLVGVQSMNFETMALVMIQYIVQLGDEAPTKGELDAAMLRARQDTSIKDHPGQHNIPQFTTVAPAQLPLLAKLAVASSNGRVKILIAQASIAEGLSDMLKWLATMSKEAVRPKYVVVIHVSRQRGTEFCVAVVGSNQVRAITESKLSTAETFKEISYEIITGKMQLLDSHFFKNSPAGHDIDALLESFSASLGGEVFIPFDGDILQKTPESVAQDMIVISKDQPEPMFTLHQAQITAAMKILSQVCTIADSDQMALDLGRFIQVHLLIIVPPSKALYSQTLTRLVQSNLLVDLGLVTTNDAKSAEPYVMQCDSAAENQAKFDLFINKVKTMPHTLFVLVQDQAHLDVRVATTGQQASAGGFAHRYVNSHGVLDAPNLLTLHISSQPYSLQTKKSRIAPHNEIPMPVSVPHAATMPDQTDSDAPLTYFGIEKYRETLKWSNRMPLLQSDDGYETMADSLTKRYPRLHSMVVRTYLLIRQYSAALMALAGIPQIQSDTTSLTYKILRDLALAPFQQTPGAGAGAGHMVLLRIPSPQLAILAHDKLRAVRDKIGYQYRLDIVLCAQDQEILLDDYFLKRLQGWRDTDSDWRPQSYEDLNRLPCIVVLAGKHLAGETMPKSLKVIDLRLVNHGVYDLTSLEQELGLGCTHCPDSAIPTVVTVAEDSDDDDDDGDDEEEDGVFEERMDYEMGGSPHPLQIDVASSQAGGDNASTKSDNMSSARSTPKSSVMETSRPPSVEGAPPSTTTTTRPVSSPGMHLSSPPPSLTPTKAQSPAPLVHPDHPTPTSNGYPKHDAGAEMEVVAGGGTGLGDSPMVAKEDVEMQEGDGKGEDDKQTVGNEDGLPMMILSGSAFNLLHKKESVQSPAIAALSSSLDTSWSGALRPALTKNTGPAKSAFYRKWTEPKSYHYDYERSEDSANYHPRRLLLYGPPQVGKTGAYLHFARVLLRMLIRLQEVEVFDEPYLDIPPALEGTAEDLESEEVADGVASRTGFDSQLREGRFKGHSPIWQPGNKQQVFSALDQRKDPKRQTTSMRLTKYSAHNAFHHCEQCQHYKYLTATEARETKAYSVQLNTRYYGEVEMQFVIPAQQEKHFVFVQQSGQLSSMVLPTKQEQGPNAVKTPIFMPSFGRQEQALINLYHTMEGSKHVHIIVCKQKDALAYEKQWPNHVLLILPSVANEAGTGAAKYFIKELASRNLELEKNRQSKLGLQPDVVWPFIALMEDNCVTWRLTSGSGAEHHESDKVVPLKTVLETIEGIPDIETYTALGVQQWSSQATGSVLTSMTSTTPTRRCHLFNMIFLNVDKARNVDYGFNRFFNEDIDFNLKLASEGHTLVRLDYLSVMVKSIEANNLAHFTPKPHPMATPHKKPPSHHTINPSSYVRAPDSEELIPLAAPPQFLMERFLERMSEKRIFPSAVDNADNPVLAVDCYFNLGPRIAVHFASSSQQPSQDLIENTRFSGLLLFMCHSTMEREFLKNFKFINGARLCLISSDRNSLRRQVVQLDLEEQWRFRLRDEFQTANVAAEQPLFMLTGRHEEERS